MTSRKMYTPETTGLITHMNLQIFVAVLIGPEQGQARQGPNTEILPRTKGDRFNQEAVYK